MSHPKSFTYSLAVATFLAGALLGGACGRAPDTGVTEVRLRAVRSSKPATAKPSPIPTLTDGPTRPRPSATPTDAPATPAPSPIGYTGKQVVVSGFVYDAGGAALSGVTVAARSLDAGTPYARSVQTDTGSFVLNGVPEGVLVELVASRPGWTSRRRVAAFQGQSSMRHEVQFGAPGGQRGDGAAHFLAPWPEIVATSPADGADGVDAAAGTYEIELSEPLGTEDRRRFEAAVRLLPANDVANGAIDDSTTDLRDLSGATWPIVRPVDGVADVAPYAVRKGSVFRGDPDTRAAFTWSADGRHALMRFRAPLLGSKHGDAAYQLVLVSGGPDERVRDGDGHQLGMDASGSFSTYPPRGDLVLGAFAREHLALRDLPGLDDGEAERWAATHDHASRFTLRADTDAPDLLAVAAGVLGNDSRIELTFSEPVVAYDGGDGFVGADLGDDVSDLARYTFAVAERRRDVEDLRLDGAGATEVDPRVTETIDADGFRERELAFAPAAFVASRDGALPGSVLIEVDPFDARRVVLVVLGRTAFFGAGIGHLKARARIEDPAGNAIRDREADAQAATTSF